ncbi:helix-turn-helix domain-containing protein [Pseudomonas sp. S2_F03]
MARHWLTAGDQPIERIAERLGYRQPSNFIRAFRQTVRHHPQAVSPLLVTTQVCGG